MDKQTRQRCEQIRKERDRSVVGNAEAHHAFNNRAHGYIEELLGMIADLDYDLLDAVAELREEGRRE